MIRKILLLIISSLFLLGSFSFAQSNNFGNYEGQEVNVAGEEDNSKDTGIVGNNSQNNFGNATNRNVGVAGGQKQSSNFMAIFGVIIGITLLGIFIYLSYNLSNLFQSEKISSEKSKRVGFRMIIMPLSILVLIFITWFIVTLVITFLGQAKIVGAGNLLFLRSGIYWIYGLGSLISIISLILGVIIGTYLLLKKSNNSSQSTKDDKENSEDIDAKE